jgi:transcriptional regulator with XRE-family HTH domain
MRSSDIVRIARHRAGLTQQQLADRSGHPRESIARWETGAREPSLSTLQSVVAACGLELVLQLANSDDSLDDLIADQLKLSPRERLDHLLAPAARRDAVRALKWIARSRTPSIVIGGVAAALQGGPQQLAGSAVEFVSSDPVATETEIKAAGLTAVDTEDRWADVDRREPWQMPGGGTIVMARAVPGSQDYADLRRSAQTVTLDGRTNVQVAHPRDLVRLADASPRKSERARVPALRALLTDRSNREARS